MWYIYINSNLYPLSSFRSSKRNTTLKDVFPRNISDMIMKIIPVSPWVIRKLSSKFRKTSMYIDTFTWFELSFKALTPNFHSRPILRDFHHHKSYMPWGGTCTEPEFKRCWTKLCSSDNHYTTAPRNGTSLWMWYSSWNNLLLQYLRTYFL